MCMHTPPEAREAGHAAGGSGPRRSASGTRGDGGCRTGGALATLRWHPLRCGGLAAAAAVGWRHALPVRRADEARRVAREGEGRRGKAREGEGRRGKASEGAREPGRHSCSCCRCRRRRGSYSSTAAPRCSRPHSAAAATTTTTSATAIAPPAAFPCMHVYPWAESRAAATHEATHIVERHRPTGGRGRRQEHGRIGAADGGGSRRHTGRASGAPDCQALQAAPQGWEPCMNCVLRARLATRPEMYGYARLGLFYG